MAEQNPFLVATDARLKKIFDELESEAYDEKQHTYDYKFANQVIRRNFEKLFEAQTAKGGQAETQVSLPSEIERLSTLLNDIIFTNGNLETKCAKLREQNEQLNQTILGQNTQLEIKDDTLNACDIAIRALSDKIKKHEARSN